MNRVVALLSALCFAAADRAPTSVNVSLSPTPADDRVPTFSQSPTSPTSKRTSKAPTSPTKVFAPSSRAPTTARPTPAPTPVPTRSGPYAQPFSANCPRPFKYPIRDQDESSSHTASLRAQMVVANYVNGWFLPVMQYIPPCFSTVGSPALTYTVTCIETNTTMPMSLSPEADYLEISVESTGWSYEKLNAGLFSVNLQIVATGLNGVASEPLMVALTYRAPRAPYSGSAFLSKTNFRTPLGEYFVAEVQGIPAAWFAGPGRCITKTIRRGSLRIVGNLECCVASKGLRVDVCFNGKKGQLNSDSTQVQAKTVTPGVQSICLGQPNLQTTEQHCAKITVYSQIEFVAIPVQYVVPNGTNAWAVDVPVLTEGRSDPSYAVYTHDVNVQATLTDGTISIVANSTAASPVLVDVIAQAGSGLTRSVSAGVQIRVVVLS